VPRLWKYLIAVFSGKTKSGGGGVEGGSIVARKRGAKWRDWAAASWANK